MHGRTLGVDALKIWRRMDLEVRRELSADVALAARDRLFAAILSALDRA